MSGPAPRVSVVIPAYNCEKYLRQTLDSVLAQTYPDFEIIVVDDGSTDGTREVANSYGGQIRYVRQENAGAAATRNHAMRLARGELIAFQDADDLWHPQKLEKQVPLFADARIGLVYCDSNFIDEAGRPIENYVRHTAAHRGRFDLELFCDHFIMTPAAVFRRELLSRVGEFDTRLRVGEDYEFFLRLAAVTEIDYVPEKLWSRRVIPGSLSRQNFILDAISDLNTLRNYLQAHPDLLARDARRIHARLAGYYFSFGYQCLERGHNALAARQFLQALRHERSTRVLKNFALCALPPTLRRRLKASIQSPAKAG